MTANHQLLTGPYSANIRDRAIVDNSAGGVWITPSDLSRDQVYACAVNKLINTIRVLTWGDLWLEVAGRHVNPPLLLSESASRAAVLEAIARVASAGELGPLAGVSGSPGLRHSIQRRIAAWTTNERKPEGASPRDDEVTRAEWAIYRRYRSILRENQAEDSAGLAVWASKNVTQVALGRPRSLTFLDPIAPSPAQFRVIDRAARSGLPVRVILPTSGDLFGDDPAIAPLRSKLVDELSFEETAYESPVNSDLGLIEATLFHETLALPTKKLFAGLAVHRGPRGDALALLLAKEIKRGLDAGINPDDMLVLFKQWTDETARTQEIMRSWGIPVSGGAARPLATEPVIAALLLAVSLPANGWEVSPLIRLLRNGQVGFSDATTKANAASRLQSLRVFRGRERLEHSLNSAYGNVSKSERVKIRAAEAVFTHLTTSLEVADTSAGASWSSHVAWLERVAARLDLGANAHDAGVLEFLWASLDDHSWLDAGDAPETTFATFVRRFESLARELSAPALPCRSGTVRFLPVHDAEGTRARVIALTNLEEGTFPSRGAVATLPDDDVFGAETVAFARERLQFLHVLGSASDEAVLLAPTSDEKGQDLLVAGFVDDLLRKLGKAADSERFITLTRLDPTFREHPELAIAPGDKRVLAVARACLDRDVGSLFALSHVPTHRPALRGVAESLRLLHDRRRDRYFNAFDGLLNDPALIAEIQCRFGPEHSFSASAIESLALCPFQFYQRYVLGVMPVDGVAELTIDRASQGARVHDTLEQIHAALRAEGEGLHDLGRLNMFIQTHVSVELTVPQSTGDVADGLHAIEDEIVRRTLRGYAQQYRKYLEKEGKTARPAQFEVGFGRTGDSEGLPSLELHDADQTVRISGKIDRIDVYEGDAGPGFRIIDYKTGHPPSKKQVTGQLLALQLPLYALAAERFLSLDFSSSCDFGYWALKSDGFKSVTPDGKKDGGWDEFRGKVVSEVIRLAGSLRRGEFPVQPKSETCTRMCEYKTVCRIGEVSQTRKEVVSLMVNK